MRIPRKIRGSKSCLRHSVLLTTLYTRMSWTFWLAKPLKALGEHWRLLCSTLSSSNPGSLRCTVCMQVPQVHIPTPCRLRQGITGALTLRAPSYSGQQWAESLNATSSQEQYAEERLRQKINMHVGVYLEDILHVYLYTSMYTSYLKITFFLKQVKYHTKASRQKTSARELQKAQLKMSTA